jgi:hypothetical protein
MLQDWKLCTSSNHYSKLDRYQGKAMSAPKVFISYSHDDADHKRWVLKLATDLRLNGVDATIDQWDLSPGQDTVSFMTNGIAHADRVLLICSENYIKKAELGSGGVGYERMIVTSEFVDSIDTKKFIPIIRSNSSSKKMPNHIGARLYVDFTSDDKYAGSLEQLVREILGEPALPKPALGASPFSSIPTEDYIEPRRVNLNGTLQNGVALLSQKWFEQESTLANAGLQKIGLTGAMELRFALHEPINKSQVELLSAVSSAQIDTFGWPIGVVVDRSPEHGPKAMSHGIRTEVAAQAGSFLGRESYDFWSMATNGDFYLLQSLFEDERDTNAIFFNTRIVRVAEGLLFAYDLYSNLGVAQDTKLSFRTSHRGLSGRQLKSSGHRRRVSPRTCSESTSQSEVTISLKDIKPLLPEYVKRLLAPMFILFDFTEFGDTIYEDIARRFEKGEVS